MTKNMMNNTIAIIIAPGPLIISDVRAPVLVVPEPELDCSIMVITTPTISIIAIHIVDAIMVCLLNVINRFAYEFSDTLIQDF